MSELNEVVKQMHLKLAEELLVRIKSGKATPADLNVARQFLKDNNVQSIPQANPSMMRLAQTLPFPTEAQSA